MLHSVDTAQARDKSQASSLLHCWKVPQPTDMVDEKRPMPRQTASSRQPEAILGVQQYSSELMKLYLDEAVPKLPRTWRSAWCDGAKLPFYACMSPIHGQVGLEFRWFTGLAYSVDTSVRGFESAETEYGNW